MKKVLENPIFSLIIRLALGGYFIFAATSKIADPAVFAKQISNYELMPLFSLNIIALVLPWIEIVTALFLIAGVRLKANSVIIGSMLVVFIIAIFTAVLRGLNIDCGCSSRASAVGIPKILEDIVWLLFAIYIYLFPVKKLTLEQLVRSDD